MKYHLDTIPVWDAYRTTDECPLCVLEYQSEQSYIDFFLSGSVMEPDTRVEVNRVGFCSYHFKLLYNEKNRLGLALITHTHLKETIDKFKKLAYNAVKNQEKGPLSPLLKKFTHSSSANTQLACLADWLDIVQDQCMVCNRLEQALNRYAYTILYLWEKDKDFYNTFKQSKGFCLHHLSLIIRMAEDTLSSKKLAQFTEELITVQIQSLETLEKDLLWFTQKFDYRNQDKPWGNSKDALPRTLQKLTGKYMEAPKIKD